MDNLSSIRTRLEKGCGKTFSYKTKKGYVQAGDNGCGKNDQDIFCPECEAKLALLDEIEPLIKKNINKWYEGESNIVVFEDDIEKLKQKILGGEE